MSGLFDRGPGRSGTSLNFDLKELEVERMRLLRERERMEKEREEREKLLQPEEPNEEEAMMAMMGFSGFNTTQDRTILFLKALS